MNHRRGVVAEVVVGVYNLVHCHNFAPIACSSLEVDIAEEVVQSPEGPASRADVHGARAALPSPDRRPVSNVRVDRDFTVKRVEVVLTEGEILD
jgi:hypothetical protein